LLVSGFAEERRRVKEGYGGTFSVFIDEDAYEYEDDECDDSGDNTAADRSSTARRGVRGMGVCSAGGKEG